MSAVGAGELAIGFTKGTCVVRGPREICHVRFGRYEDDAMRAWLLYGGLSPSRKRDQQLCSNSTMMIMLMMAVYSLLRCAVQVMASSPPVSCIGLGRIVSFPSAQACVRQQEICRAVLQYQSPG